MEAAGFHNGPMLIRQGVRRERLLVIMQTGKHMLTF